MRAEVGTVQPGDIEQNWPWISGFLDEVESLNPGWTQEEVKAALIAESAQLWFASVDAWPVGIWITRLGKCGETPIGLVWIAAGSPLEVGIELFRQYTEPWFKEKGCKRIEINGRKGWARVLPDFREASTVFVKELT